MASSHEEIAVTPCTYDVFLSFRGKDTRTHFTDHLYSALKQAGFHTFRDDDELVRGENIEAELQKAIRESRISVVVFSKDYASSTWCLDELVMIMNKRRNDSHAVLPVFYDVSPSLVRRQTGCFASSFSKHEKHFKGETDKINRWREALNDVADLSGMELKDGYEAKFNHDIVGEVRNKLRPRKLDLTSHLVGIDLRVTEIEGWLHDETGISMGQIYGIGGIGKTTIAKFLYNENFQRFESSSFVSKIKDASKDQHGLIRLQNQLLSDILKGKKHDAYDTEDGIVKIRNALSCKKVLIILDDVDDSNQLEALLGERRLQLYPGSKIILTSRNDRLQWGNHFWEKHYFKKFRIKGLDENESLELFSWHTFCQNHPINGYLEFSKEATQWCRGLPLALKVVGSSLYGRKNIDVWRCTLEKLKVIPHSDVQRILRISYDSLEDDRDRALFLDVACFFVGMEKNYVTAILDGCGFHMLNDLTYTKKTSSLQVLEEDGVLNIFSPADDDNPNCFNVLKHPFGKYISFDVLPNDGHKKIYGMNICISYKVSHYVLHEYLYDAFIRRVKYFGRQFCAYLHYDYEYELKVGLPDLPEKALLLGITNKTKKLVWVYGPTCYAIPRDEEKIQWVSHWRFGDQFEVGDKVSIHVSKNYGFEINDMKCGVKLVYEDEENCEVDWEQTPLDSCWSQREGTPGGVKRFPMDESWEREIEDSDSTKTYEDEDVEEDSKSIIDLINTLFG